MALELKSNSEYKGDPSQLPGQTLLCQIMRRFTSTLRTGFI